MSICGYCYYFNELKSNIYHLCKSCDYLTLYNYCDSCSYDNNICIICGDKYTKEILLKKFNDIIDKTPEILNIIDEIKKLNN